MFPDECRRWFSGFRQIAAASAAALLALGCGAAEILAAEGDARPVSRLITETSPHLRRSMDSLVEWRPWGPAAAEEARRAKKPLFVSISYFSCHWCATMSRDSFGRSDVARYLNDHFVPVKVDRFERPDLDRFYQRWSSVASQAEGGWPMNLWMTPDGVPYRSAAFLPSTDQGRGTFLSVAEFAGRTWEQYQDSIPTDYGKTIDKVKARLSEATDATPEARKALLQSPAILDVGASQMAAAFDPVNGGFSRTPKFPAPAKLEFLRRQFLRLPPTADNRNQAAQMVSTTLGNMARGGLRDHLAGGFFRYSIDEAWQRPYFEKLALDQAEMAKCYLMGYQLSGNEGFAALVRETLEYVERDLSHPEGGFFNSEHSEALREPAAIEPQEGAYYVWNRDDFRSAAGTSADVLEWLYGVADRGNAPLGSDAFKQFVGLNLIYQKRTLTEVAQHFQLNEEEAARMIDQGRVSLLLARTQRPRPALERLVTAQNMGALISAFARAGTAFGDPRYVGRAVRAARFTQDKLWDGANRRLRRSWAGRPGQWLACAEDYAALTEGIVDLYEATGDAQWLRWALELQTAFSQWHGDQRDGGFFDAASDVTDLPFRLKNDDDAATFSSNALAALNLMRLGAMMNDTGMNAGGLKTIQAFTPHLQNPKWTGALGGLLCAADSSLRGYTQIVIAGDPASPEAAKVRSLILRAPAVHRVLVYADGGAGQALLSGKNSAMGQFKPMPDGSPAVYICLGFQPRKAAFPAAEMEKHLSELEP